MKRHLVFCALVAIALGLFGSEAFAAGRGGGGFRGGGHGRSAGLGGGGCGIGIGGIGGIGFGGGGCGWDIAELYRELYNNLPYFALHPPVYYSDVVPRTYGYSPFAYPPGVMTPDLACMSQPVTINNPYVPATKPAVAPAKDANDRAAAVEHRVEPLVIVNPYVTNSQAVVQNAK